MASNDTRSSFGDYDENFAQARNTAENWDPADEAFANEGHRLKAGLLSALEELETSRRSVDPEAAAAAEEAYEKAAAAWGEYEATLKEDLLVRPGYLALADALGVDLETGEDLSAEAAEARLQAFGAMVEYVMQSGVANLGQGFKNFLAVVRRIRPQSLDGISQSDLAILLDERKASTSAREKRVVEKLAKKAGVHGFHFLGGTKSEETRRRCARAQKGNRNRRTGAKKRRL